MILADLGADVIRIERPGGNRLGGGPYDYLTRGRPSVALDLKQPDAANTVLELVERADILVEGMRPGAMERLGLGPDACWERNARLVYGRMTGWGQEGPWATAAGHDINYVAVTGALDTFGQDPARPHFPSNVVGDFGGGSTYLVIGLLAALREASLSSRGQVVDAAIVDGTAHLNAMASGYAAAGRLRRPRGTNLLDGGVPWYAIYETADDRHVAVGALEPQFYAELVRLLELEDQLPSRDEPGSAEKIREVLGATFAARPLSHWQELFAGTDACVAPVLTMEEAPAHPHVASRGTFVNAGGHMQPAPAPRFSRTSPSVSMAPASVAGEHTRDALTAWGIRNVEDLILQGAAVQADAGEPARRP
jgi:alpha-methylacyl-CoA racemase